MKEKVCERKSSSQRDFEKFFIKDHCPELYRLIQRDKRRRRKVITLPENCLYDLSDGLPDCIKERTPCSEECYYNVESYYNFSHGTCHIHEGMPLGQDDRCEHCD